MASLLHRRDSAGVRGRGSSGPSVGTGHGVQPSNNVVESALWIDLDSGAGVWDNIPTAIRQGFRALLSHVQSSASSGAATRAVAAAEVDDLAAVVTEEVEALKTQQAKLQDTVRQLQQDSRRLSDTIVHLQQYVSMWRLGCGGGRGSSKPGLRLQ